MVIAGVILFVRSRQSPPQTKTQTQDLVTVSPPTETGGWQLVRHPIFNISFKLPPAWKITVFDNGKGRTEGDFFGVGATAVINIDQKSNPTGLNPDKFIEENKKLNPFRVNRGLIQGIGYVTKETAEDDPGPVEDSYFLVNQYFISDKVLAVSCGLSGPNYKTMIPTCEEITKSLQFNQ